jgi:hypothetical protein
MSRTDPSVPAKTDRAVASGGTSPRIHVVRLPKSVVELVTGVTAPAPKES